MAWFDRSRLSYTHSLFTLRLGEGYLRQGVLLQARGLFAEVLASSQEAGYRQLEGVAERCLGESMAAENPTAAVEHLESARRILQEVGARNEVAKVLVAQATLRRASGDAAGARVLLERALALFETLGTLDEPLRVRAALAVLQENPPA